MTQEINKRNHEGQFWKGVSWIAGAAFLFAGISFVGAGIIFIGFLYAISGLIIFPLTYRVLEKKLHPFFPNWLRISLLIFLLVLIGNHEERQPIREAKQVQAIAAPTTPQLTAPKIECKTGMPISGRFFITKDGTAFRTGAGVKYEKVTAAIIGAIGSKNTVKLELSSDYVLEGLCETQELLQGKIVEFGGSASNGETGWVQKKFTSSQPSENYKNMKADMAVGLEIDFNIFKELSQKERQILRKGSLKILQDEPNCAKVTGGYRAAKKGRYYVTCDSRNNEPPFNVWFTSKDVSSGENLAAPTPFPEDQSNMACWDAIRSNASHPSTVDIHSFAGHESYLSKTGTAERVIIQNFSAKNGFNLELEYQAECVISPDGNVRISIAETM